MFLLLVYLLADSIDLYKLCHICLYEFNLSILVQCLAFLDDTLCGTLVSTDDIDMWGDGVVHERFCCIFADA